MEGERCLEAEFIDDYRLLAVLEATQAEPPSLLLIDTGNDVEGTPLQTVFFLPPRFGDFGYMELHLEQGAHEPSPAESLVPFYQDPPQRIAVLEVKRTPYHFVFLVEALLEFGDRGRSEIGWDEWENCVDIPYTLLHEVTRSDIWVPGSRLFAIYQWTSSFVKMVVHGFSARGRGI